MFQHSSTPSAKPAWRRLSAGGGALLLLLAACSSTDTGDSTAAVAPTVDTAAVSDDTPATAPAEAPTEAPATPTSEGATQPEPVQTTDPVAEAPTEAPAVPEETEPEPEPVDIGENQLPDVMVLNVATGEELNLRSLAPAETPIVLWFWAPH